MKRRTLSPDERALWRRATHNVRRQDDAPSVPGLTSVPGPPGLKLGETSRETMFPVRAARPAGAAGDRPPTKQKPAPASAFAAGDPALERRARRGRVRPERVIDLHGMTQIAARVALVSFLDAARRDGCRCVLIVTGKGARAPERDYAAESAPRGVIRRRFQEWLDEEPLRAMIARAAPAAPRDGGAGAFYVFLKSKGARL